MNDQVLRLLMFGGFVTVLFIGAMIYANDWSKKYERKRLVALPGEVDGALKEALKQTKKCFAMLGIQAFARNLRQKSGLGAGSRRRDRSDARLLSKARGRAEEALKRCLALSSEAVSFTCDEQYYGLQQVFECAVAVCGKCSQTAGQNVCRALALIKEISLEEP